MNNYFIVAKAKYNMKIDGVLYAIGQTLPTEMNEKTYEFFKDAMIIESCTLIENKTEPKKDNTDIQIANSLLVKETLTITDELREKLNAGNKSVETQTPSETPNPIKEPQTTQTPPSKPMPKIIPKKPTKPQ